MRYHKPLGWILALAWLAAAGLLLVSLPDIEAVGEYGVFLSWTPISAPLAVLTWAWAFGPTWRSKAALTTLTGVIATWIILAYIGADGRLHLAARDAFFLRQAGTEFALRSVLWLYLLYPLAIMTAACLAIVEYLRYPPAWVAHPSPEPSIFWGSEADRREALVVLAGAIVLSVLYTIIAASMGAGPSRLEFIGTTTGLANVWLVRKQNILSWPLGAVMVASVGWVFFDQYNLMGQALIHLLYFFPIQFWGWYHWARGGEEHGELGLSWTPTREWLVYVPVYIVGSWALGNFAAAAYEQAAYVYWDASIVAASVVALFLQGRKKVESWFLWIGPVNVAAIGLYTVTGAMMFAALYVVFLANAIAGAWDWAKESKV